MRPARTPPLVAARVPQRSERLEARIPAELKDLYARAAAARGQTLTDFVVSAVTAAAHKVVRESELLELSRRDQQAFAAALLCPPAPSAKLRDAAAWASEQTASHE